MTRYHIYICRRNMVGSLPRGMPVDCRQTDEQATNKTLTQDKHEVLSWFGRQEGITPTSCVWFVLLYVNERCFFRGIPCPPYIVRGAGLQIWKLILISYNCHKWPDKDSYSNRPGSCLIAKSVLTPCAGLRTGWLGRASSFSGPDPLIRAGPSLAIRV